MSYDKIIEEAFENIIKLSAKLNEYDSKYLVKNIRIIANHINISEKRITKISSYNNKIDEAKYNDTLNYFMTICMLHGYVGVELEQDKFEKFVHWFYINAMSSGVYQAEKVSKKILIAFFDSFNLFEFTYNRIPDDYNELRSFLFTWEDVIDERMSAEIEKITEKMDK